MSSNKVIDLARKEKRLDTINWAWKYTNGDIQSITKTIPIKEFIMKQNTKWIAHVARASNDTLTKRLMFVDENFTKRGKHQNTVLENVTGIQEGEGKTVETFLKECTKRKL